MLHWKTSVKLCVPKAFLLKISFKAFVLWHQSSVLATGRWHHVLQTSRWPTSPLFLCSSVSSSWCRILIWAISCCRASLRLESWLNTEQWTCQRTGDLQVDGWTKSDWGLTWTRVLSGLHTCQPGTSQRGQPGCPTSPADGDLKHKC